jgi:hypothetical protein
MGRRIILIFLVAAGGCESKLETGYKYTPLGASEEQRRAFYAPAFSPQTHKPLDEGGAPVPMRYPDSRY